MNYDPFFPANSIKANHQLKKRRSKWKNTKRRFVNLVSVGKVENDLLLLDVTDG